MNTLEDDYLCVGVCMDDADGYCLGCGRPPLPELAVTQNNAGIRKDEPVPEPEAEASAERLTGQSQNG